jgi:ATP-binding cassette, subfamily C, bacteriocin exporter
MIQHDSSDCGAACLVSIIRFYGGNSTIEEVRRLTGTSISGVTMLGLYQAAQQIGLDVSGYEASVKDIIEYRNELILHVNTKDGLEHFIINFGYGSGKFIVWDPAKGLLFLSEEELDSIWMSRKCLGIAPGPLFKTEKSIDRGKKEWLLNTVKPEKNLLILSGVIGVLISILGLVMAVFTQKLIDRILPLGELKVLILTSVLVLILLVSRIILTAIRQFFLLSQGRLFNIRVVDDFYKNLLFLPKSFFDTRKTGDFVARLNDTMRIQRIIAEVVGTYIIDVLIFCITISMIFYYSTVTGILSLICLPLLYLMVLKWNKTILSAQHEVMAGYALSESNFIDTLKGITEIKGMNWQDTFSARNNFVYSEFQNRSFLLGKIKVRLTLITGLAGTLYLIIVLLYSSIQVIKSEMSQGELIAILTLCSALLPSALNLALIEIPFSEAKVALNRMFEYTLIKPEEKLDSETEAGVSINKVVLENISFRFPGQRLLFNNINLKIEKGKLVSIVGESGCGKSTLASILLRFYSVESGKIIINSDNVSEEIGLKIWRSKIGIIPQEIHIFNGTILQNLISDLSEVKIKEVVSVLSLFGLNDFIGSFPSGLMTLVGEEGINLSGGQKQLVGFVRALINKPDILIIDEGTSGMDRSTECMVMNLIIKLKSEMGVLLITHRLNLIRNLSDYIYIIENGSILNEGTHSELMKMDNLYKRYWDDFY